MKILLVTGPNISLKQPYNSGIESFVAQFANQLVQEGHIVDVVAKNADKCALFTLVNPFINMKKTRIKRLRRFEEKKQFKSINFDNYDIIHFNMFYPHLFKALLKSNTQITLTLHCPVSSTRAKAYKNLIRKTNTTFISISERNKIEWDNILNIDTTKIENGIDMGNWPAKNRSNGDYYLWSGRINQEKNPRAAIELANSVKMPLKIAGKIADQKYFNSNVKPFLNEDIQYVGHVNQYELSQLANDASIYLATATWQEPFGLASLEMLASGLNIIGFKTAVPQDWNHSSVKVINSSDWRALLPCLKNPVVSPSICRSFAKSMSIEAMTRKYQALFAQLTIMSPTSEVLFTTDTALQAATAPILAVQAQVSK